MAECTEFARKNTGTFKKNRKKKFNLAHLYRLSSKTRNEDKDKGLNLQNYN
jgi:hypothetical protein